MTNRRFDCRLLAGRVVHLSRIARSIYRRLTGAGGIGAPSRPPFGVRRVLLARKSMVGFSFASFFASTRFLPSSLAGMPFFVCASDVSANGWGETSLAAQDFRRNRVRRGLCWVAFRAEEIAPLAAADGKRQYRADVRPGAGRWHRFRTGQPHRHYHLARYHSAEVTVDVTCEFHCAGFSEMHAVGCAQPPGLPFKVRTLGGIASLIIDKAVPNVDVNNSGLFSALAKEFVQIAYVASRLRANRRQPDPKRTGTPLLLSAAIIASMRFT